MPKEAIDILCCYPELVACLSRFFPTPLVAPVVPVAFNWIKLDLLTHDPETPPRSTVRPLLSQF